MAYKKEVQLKATQKYMAKRHSIRVIVPKEKAEEYKLAAKNAGKSLSQFVIDCVEKEISGRD